MRLKYTPYLVVVTLLLSLYGPGLAKASSETKAHHNRVQGLIGVMEFKSDTYTRQDSAGDNYQGKMPTIPVFGGMWQYGLFGGDTVTLGAEGGILFGFDSYSTTLIGGGNGLYVHIKNKFFLIDGMIGLNIDIHPGNRVRLYAGAGPLLMYGNLKTDNDDEASIDIIEDESAGAADIGLYARAGFEIRVTKATFCGFQARYVDAELDFGRDLGEFDMQGMQYMLTFTRNF